MDHNAYCLYSKIFEWVNEKKSLDYNIRWHIYTSDTKSLNTYIKDLKKHQHSSHALIFAYYYNKPNMIKYFLENGFSPDVDGGQMLICLINHNQYHIVELFLQYGANPNHNHGHALYRASKNNNKEIVNLLLKYGAKMKYMHRDYSDYKLVQKQTLLMGLYYKNSKIYEVFISAELSERYLLKTIMSYL
jgi:ankyrin repeat protein